MFGCVLGGVTGALFDQFGAPRRSGGRDDVFDRMRGVRAIVGAEILGRVAKDFPMHLDVGGDNGLPQRIASTPEKSKPSPTLGQTVAAAWR